MRPRIRYLVMKSDSQGPLLVRILEKMHEFLGYWSLVLKDEGLDSCKKIRRPVAGGETGGNSSPPQKCSDLSQVPRQKRNCSY